MSDDDDLLTSAETARLLRVHPKHLYRLLRRGLPGHRVGRGNWRFKRAEILAWLEARERGGRARDACLDIVSAAGSRPGPRWFVGRIGGRWVGHAAPVDHAHAADAFSGDAAVVGDAVRVSASRDLAELSANILVAGCAPLLGALLDRFDHGRARGRAHWLSVNSTAALRLLADGFVHTAGIHLADDEAGLDHGSIVRRVLPRRSFHLVHLVRWRQGLVVRPRSAKRITAVQDLAQPEVRVALREKGSGARRVLDRALERAGIKRKATRSVATLGDHRSVARAVALGAFDAGVTVESAAVEAGLHFIPIVEEGFDLVVPIDLVDASGMETLLGMLDSRLLRREVAALGPYDAARMGQVQTIGARA